MLCHLNHRPGSLIGKNLTPSHTLALGFSKRFINPKANSKTAYAETQKANKTVSTSRLRLSRTPLTIPRGILFRASAGQHHLCGLKQYCQIQHDREMFDVEQVVFEFRLCFFDARTILIFDLCPSSYARTDRMPQSVVGDLLFQHRNKLGTFRARTYNAHFAAQYVDGLRQLIDARFPKPPAYSRYPWITGRSPLRTTFFSIGIHRTELQHRKRTSM